MKNLEFTTSNGQFILQDCPKELVEFTFSESTRLAINGIKYKPFGIVKHMTEEQFAEVVQIAFNTPRMYKDYINNMPGFTAKQSFESLIKSLGWHLFKNPIQTSIATLTDIEQTYRQLDADWQEAESKTLYNPVLLIKK